MTEKIEPNDESKRLPDVSLANGTAPSTSEPRIMKRDSATGADSTKPRSTGAQTKGPIVVHLGSAAEVVPDTDDGVDARVDLKPIAGVSSFADFYRLHYPAIARALAVTLGRPDLGREAADEAMTRAYAKWGSVSGYDNPAGWVYRVGLNWGRSWHRRAARKLPWGEWDRMEMPKTADPDLADAIQELDPKYRAVVVCRYLLDWSTEQTAEALQVKPGTVKSRLHSGLAQLRSRLGEDT